MRLRHPCGVWELFVPNARAGQFYKYEVKTVPPRFVFRSWFPVPSRPNGGRAWLQSFQIPRPTGGATAPGCRCAKQRDALHAPLAIFEVHLGSWRRKPEEGARCLTYAELAEELPTYAKELGFTHVEFLPVSEFNFEGSLSYHPIALYAPTDRFGTPGDFRLLVDRFHQKGIGVILNWVPVQFPDDPQAPVQKGVQMLVGDLNKLMRQPSRRTKAVVRNAGLPGLTATTATSAPFPVSAAP